MICKTCKHKNNKNSKYCANCGEDLFTSEKGFSAIVDDFVIDTSESEKILKKHRIVMLLLSIFLLLGMALVTYQLQPSVQKAAAIDTFVQALNSDDIEGLAAELTGDGVFWDSSNVNELKKFIEDEGINLKKEFQKLDGVKSTVYTDDRQNKIFQLRRLDNVVGIVPQYEIKVLPLEVTVRTNQESIDFYYRETANHYRVTKDEPITLKLPFTNDDYLFTIVAVNSKRLSEDYQSMGYQFKKLDKAKDNKVDLDIDMGTLTLDITAPEELKTALSDAKVSVGNVDYKGIVNIVPSVMLNQEVSIYISVNNNVYLDTYISPYRFTPTEEETKLNLKVVKESYGDAYRLVLDK